MKKGFIIIIACVLAISLFAAGYLIIFPKICDISIMITKPVDANEKHYHESFMLAFGYMPKSKQALANTLSDTNGEYLLAFWEEHKEDSYHIEIDVSVENGQTIIVYSGTITDGETGETQPYEKKFVHDFVITKDIC